MSAVGSHADAPLQLAFASHLRDPDRCPPPPGLNPDRVATYRRLFFNNVESVLRANFPVISTLLGADQWPRLVRQFYSEFPSHVPLFTELAREFVRFLQTSPGHWHEERPFLAELAHYEWIELELMLDPVDLDGWQGDPDADLLSGRPLVSPAARLLSYQFPVHQIRLEFQPIEVPDQPSFLVVYRNRSDQIGFMAMNAVSARLLELLADPELSSGAAAVAQIAMQLGLAGPDSLFPVALQQMQQWLQRDILLGARSPSA